MDGHQNHASYAGKNYLVFLELQSAKESLLIRLKQMTCSHCKPGAMSGVYFGLTGLPPILNLPPQPFSSHTTCALGVLFSLHINVS